MHFNPNQPHGVIMNHPFARYEQDGKLYDFAGHRIQTECDHEPPREEPEAILPPPKLEPGERDFRLEQAREFLENILKEGALRRTEVFKVAEENNQDWEKVKQAFAVMEGEVFNRKNSLYWKLKAA